MSSFQAIVAREPGAAELCELSDADLPEGDVTVAVSHSSLNYKDGLAVTDAVRIIRSYPMICGIDLAGVVESSRSPRWHPGDEVLVTGWGLSETHPGGYTQRQHAEHRGEPRRADRHALRRREGRRSPRQPLRAHALALGVAAGMGLREAPAGDQHLVAGKPAR